MTTSPPPVSPATLAARDRARFFDATYGPSPAQRRGLLRNEVVKQAEAFTKAAHALLGREDDLDLTLERYDRAAERLIEAVEAFDRELDSAPIPEPRRRRPRTP